MSYGLGLSPAQAPLNCFGSGTISRSKLSSRILSRLRPRHYRKAEYNGRLRDGDAFMTGARDLFQQYQHCLAYDARRGIQGDLDGLSTERNKLHKFSDYGRLQRMEADALSRAETFRANASRVYTIIQDAQKYTHTSPTRQNVRTFNTSPQSAHQSSRSSSRMRFSGDRVSGSGHAHGSGRSAHAPLSQVSNFAEEPLEMIQTRAGPVSWTPCPEAPGDNVLGLELGPRTSPRPPTMISSRTPIGSVLSLNMSLAQFSPVHMSPANGSPADSIGAYSLASDGFPRPSRRAATARRRSTIQTTTSMSKSPPSRQNSQFSHTSHTRQSVESSGQHSGSHRSTSRRPVSRDGYRRQSYTRTTTSLRTSSVPPAYRASPSGASYRSQF